MAILHCSRIGTLFRQAYARLILSAQNKKGKSEDFLFQFPAGTILFSGEGGPASSRAPCLMPALPVVIACRPNSVSVSSLTFINAPGLDMSLDSLTKASAGCLVTVFISIPFRDEVADSFGARTNNFHHIVAFKQRAVT